MIERERELVRNQKLPRETVLLRVEVIRIRGGEQRKRALKGRTCTFVAVFGYHNLYFLKCCMRKLKSHIA